jgi:hypothetical protein
MTDEAHRSQYSLLGANLDKGIPKSARIGFTGTPIDKTERVFGNYIDKYTMRQSIADGVTLEIVYEGRTHDAEVPDKTGTDTAFQDVFGDYNLRERLEILGYTSALSPVRRYRGGISLVRCCGPFDPRRSVWAPCPIWFDDEQSSRGNGHSQEGSRPVSHHRNRQGPRLRGRAEGCSIVKFQVSGCPPVRRARA